MSILFNIRRNLTSATISLFRNIFKILQALLNLILFSSKIFLHLSKKNFLFILIVINLLFFELSLRNHLFSQLYILFQLLKFKKVSLQSHSLFFNGLIIVNEGEKDIFNKILISYEYFLKVEKQPKDVF